MPLCANCTHYHSGHPNAHFSNSDKEYRAGWCSRIVTKRKDEYESLDFPGVHIFIDNPFECGTLLVDPIFGCMLHNPTD